MFLFFSFNFDHAWKWMKIAVGQFYCHVAGNALKLLWVHLYVFHEGEFTLQVAFPIKIRRLNIAKGVLLWRMEEQKICWNFFVIFDFDDITNSDLLPWDFNKFFVE